GPRAGRPYVSQLLLKHELMAIGRTLRASLRCESEMRVTRQIRHIPEIEPAPQQEELRRVQLDQAGSLVAHPSSGLVPSARHLVVDVLAEKLAVDVVPVGVEHALLAQHRALPLPRLVLGPPGTGAKIGRAHV